MCLYTIIRTGNTAKRSMFLKGAIMVHNDKLYKLALNDAKAENKSALTRSLLVDELIAVGMTETFNTQRKIDGKMAYLPEAQDCRTAIVAAYGRKAQKLMSTPTKDLADSAKTEKRLVTQQVGSRMSKIAKEIGYRLNPQERGTVERKPDDVWMRDAYNAFVKRVETSEGAGDLDLVEIAEWLAKSPLA